MQNPRHAAIAEARRLRQRQALRCRARDAATSHLSCEDSSIRTGKAAVAHGCNSWWRQTGLRPSPAAAQTILCRVWQRLQTSPGGRLPQRAGVWPAIVAGVAGRRSDATLWASGRCAPVSRDGGRRAQAHRPHRRSKCEGAPGRPRHHQSNQGGVRMVKPHLSPEWRGPDHACGPRGCTLGSCIFVDTPPAPHARRHGPVPLRHSKHTRPPLRDPSAQPTRESATP